MIFKVVVIVSLASVVAASVWLVTSRQTYTTTAGVHELTPGDGVRGIVGAFQRHNVVLIGERHGLKEAGDFYIRLVRDPAFQQAVQDIVIEFASRQNQPLIARYIDGNDIPQKELQHIWRDTTKVGAWESPVYAEWLAAIREVNRTLSPSKRLRVFAGDTAIDWDRIRTHDEWAALGDNNISFSDVILHEVLAKGDRALVVLGSNHIMRSGDRNGGPNVTTRLESRYPKSTFVVLLLNARTFDQEIEKQLNLPGTDPPALYTLYGTRAATISDQKGFALIQKADGLLYLGPSEALHEVNASPNSFESEYLRELDRRSVIEWGDLRIRRFLGLPSP